MLVSAMPFLLADAPFLQLQGAIPLLAGTMLISFIAMSAYLLLLTGEISFGQQAFFAISAYASGIATAMWAWPLHKVTRMRRTPCTTWKFVRI